MDVHIRLERDWSWLNQIAVKGTAFWEAQKAPLTGKALANYFQGCGEARVFMNRVRGLNGFFAVFVKTPNGVFAAVDRVRSIPLFYAIQGTNIYLSDNARWIWEQLGLPDIDTYSAAEFLLTGYVTGPHTLVKDINQLQAGEILSLDVDTGELHIERYYRYLHRHDLNGSKEDLLERLDLITRKAIERLITFAEGRTIVIPLSGGLDSRLIAMWLKKLGYSRIIAFSYGRPGNAETHVSRQVAEQLSILWKFVPYSHELWRVWYRSPEYRAYVEMADGLCSVAHIQDWPAVWWLLQNGEIPEEAIFVPGHSADFVAGSHIPSELIPLRRVSLKRVVQAVWDHHYSLTDVKNSAAAVDRPVRDVLERLKARVCKLLEGIPNTSAEEAVSAYEYWDWQERQAKFIVNSVRVYDFWGYQWWLPWWDSEFLGFWETVPLHYRINKNLYDTYVICVQAALNLSLAISKAHGLLQRTKVKAKEVLDKTGLGTLSREVYSLKRALRANREYQEHPLAWYGVTDVGRFMRLVGRRGNINTVLACDQLAALRGIR
jgi:asparagine synthase (glutamine-hydrolysing)